MLIGEGNLHIYIEESLESLLNLEKNILAIEEKVNNINVDTFNNLFKAVHTIKSGAAVMGLVNIKELSQKIEDAVGLIREKQIKVDSEIINTLLNGCDKLRELINNIYTNNNVDIAESIVALTGLTSTYLPFKEKKTIIEKIDICHPDGRYLFSISLFNYTRAVRQKKNIYLIEYDLIQDGYYKNKTPFDIIKSINELGDIMEGTIDIFSVGTLDDKDIPDKLPFFVLISSNEQPESIFQNPFISNEKAFIIKEKDKLIPVVDYFSLNKIEKEKLLQNNYKKIKFINYDTLDSLSKLTNDLISTQNQLLKNISFQNLIGIDKIKNSFDNIISDIYKKIMQTRMQPLGTLLKKIYIYIQDYSKKFNKKVKLIVNHNNIELDQGIINDLYAQILIIIKNIIKHGIETKQERIKAGKSENAIIQINAFTKEKSIYIEITNDGNIEDNFEEKFGLIDIKKNIEYIGGKIEVVNNKDKGVSFNIILSKDLLIIETLLVYINNNILAIPKRNVVKIVEAEDNSFEIKNNTKFFKYNCSLIPIIQFIANHELRKKNSHNIVILSSLDQKFGIIIENLYYPEKKYNYQKIIVRQTGIHLKKCDEYFGAAMLKDGNISLILNVENMAKKIKY